MVSVELALRLREAGLRWTPSRGDRFYLPDRNMDEDVFVLSDMTVEVHEFPSGSVIGFNGVTEWALDSIEQQEAVWLPSEGQLRALLGGLFVRLEAVNGAPDGSLDRSGHGYVVTVRSAGRELRFASAEPSEAYGEALLDVLLSVSSRSA